MASSQTPTSTATMLASFPPMVVRIIGEPTLQVLIRVQNTHLIPCAQSHVTTRSAINLLYLCVPANTYAQCTTDPYPAPRVNQGNWDGAQEDTPLGRQVEKAIWDGLYTNFWNEININRALFTGFLVLLD